MPFVAQVAVGKRAKLSVFGDDYETVDGTGIRDYIHVDDLASGHLAALDYLQQHAGVLTVNLGTGKGTSIFQLIHAFERASVFCISYEVVPRRMGDLLEYYAQADFALAALGWKAEHDIARMCQDSWRWQSQNPKGFAD
jgi:UDP-glucose 4-epimerase